MATWKAGLLGVLVTFIGLGLLGGLVAALVWAGPVAFLCGLAVAIAVIGWVNGVGMWGRE